MQEEEKKMILVNSTISVEVVIVGGGMVSGITLATAGTAAYPE